MTATLDWLGCATFRLTLGERVVYLDAYLDRVPSAKPIGLRVADVDRADWIVVGHSHFDHLYGAERIARQTGATIIGSYETVRIMEAQGIPDRQLIAVAGSETVRLCRLVLSHHDDWLPGFSRAIDVAPIREALAQSAPATELVEMGYLSGTPIFADLPSRPRPRV